MKNISPKQTLLFLAVVFLAFTPFYGFGYLVAIIVAAQYVGFSRTFNTLFARSVLAFIVLTIAIMITGVVTWAVKVPIHPLFVLITFSGIYFVFKRLQKNNHSRAISFDKSDVISLSLALVPVVIMGLSFFFPKATPTATIQVITNGIDASAHLSLLRSTGTEKSYIYGTHEETKNKVMQDSGSYPQGWHLATSHIVSGFGGNPFVSSQPILSITALLGVMLFWLALAIFVFSRVAWQLLGIISKKLQTKPWVTIGLFSLANLTFQLLVFWPSFRLGFANYLGCLVYITVIAAMIIDKRDSSDNLLAYFFGASLATVAVAQSWLLPIPAVLGMVFLGFFLANPVVSFRGRVSDIVKKHWVAFLIALLLIAGVAFQAGILVAFSAISPSDQLIAKGGFAPLSKVLFALLAATAIYTWLRAKTQVKSFEHTVVAVILPMILFCGIIYVYQIYESDVTGYYLVKTMGLTLCLIGLFFVPAFVFLFQKLPFTSPVAVLLTASTTLMLLTVGTAQSTISFNYLFQRHSTMVYETAREVDSIFQSDKKDDQLIIFRGKNLSEDVVGTYFYSRVMKQSNACSSEFILLKKHTIKHRLETLDNCAKTSPEPITVITSDKTDGLVRDLKHKNINVIFVK